MLYRVMLAEVVSLGQNTSGQITLC